MILDKLKITFRKAKANDAYILSEYRVKFINEVFEIKTHPDAEQLKIELVEYFSQSIINKSVIAWLAEYENRIISTSCLVIWSAPPSYSSLKNKGKRGYILNMYTLNEFRRMGIASVLLEKLILEAKKMTLEFINLHATNDGIKVYKNMEFREPKFPELKLKIE